MRTLLANPWIKAAAFAGGTAAIWGLYFTWRPPLPMLYLKHMEHLGRESRQVSITIDDAPHPLTTPLLLAALERADVKASFFCVGDSMRLYPELAQRIVREGHRLANHSQPHHNLTRVPPENFARHIDDCFIAIDKVEADVTADAAGGSVPAANLSKTALFRPPGGGMNRELMDYLYRRDYTLAWWSNNVGDWTCPPPWKIADGVKANMRAGDVILLHDGGTGTPQAIPSIVREARDRGLEFIVMPEAAPR